MKSSFSRSFTTAATILLLALVILGASFQLQVNDFMEDSTISGLRQDASVISNLAAAYSIDGNLSSREFLLNLDIASQVTDADVIICDANGYIILCSDALIGCEHQGLQLNREYLQKVIENGGDTATGVIKGLYSDQRYVAAAPIAGGNGISGIAHSRRGLTPLGRLQKYPKFHVSTGEESSDSGTDSTQGLRPRY